MSLSTSPSNLQGSIIISEKLHSKRDSLALYVTPKVHADIRNKKWSKIIVRGHHDRTGPSTRITDNEKHHQLFNWQRPTATRIDETTLAINCFPGQDYVEHYARMIATYLDLNGRKDKVVIEKPRRYDARDRFCRSNLLAMGKVDVVVVGDLHCFSDLQDVCWDGDEKHYPEEKSLFRWKKIQQSGAPSFAFLGCKVSLWGDIAGQLVTALGEYNSIKYCIYTAKAGSLRADDIPNTRIATGTRSFLHGVPVSWKPNVKIPRLNVVHEGLHTTVASPLLETEDWLVTQRGKGVDWVDCEIGHMAYSAQVLSVSFTYLHILSDNVAKKYDFNLSNEDEAEVTRSRKQLFDELWTVLRTTLMENFRLNTCREALTAVPMADTSGSTRLFFDNGTRSWQQQIGLNDSSLFANDLREGVNVIFTKLRTIREDPNARNQWSSRLGIPDTFWSETSTRHNGYFGSSTYPYKRGKTLTRYDTTFRLIVKRLEPQKEYDWLEMSFFSRWTDRGNLFICFDSPEDFPQQFMATLDAHLNDTSEPFHKPYAFHVILLDALVPIYDRSVWDLSTRIRKIEENREPMDKTDIPRLHEVARHTAHATETVQVAGNVIERMASECEALAERENDDDAEQAMHERLESLRMHHSMMLGVAARLISNEKRLSNEINLVSNVMAQKDNGVNLQIARATRADSVALKTIAIVTSTFLPATYVSALLGMNFFSYNPDTHGGHITYSPDLWIYFVVSIPLTVAVLTIWWVWQRREEMAENLENSTEKAVKSAGTETSSSGSR